MLTTQYHFNANKVDEECNSGLKEITAVELSIFHIYIHAHRFLKAIQLFDKYVAPHKFKPSSLSQGYVEIRTLSHVGGGSRCGGVSCTGYYVDDLWLQRHTLAYREGIVLKAAWNWGSKSSVVNDPLGEEGRIPLYEYVGLPTARGSADGDRYVFPVSWKSSLTRDSASDE